MLPSVGVAVEVVTHPAGGRVVSSRMASLCRNYISRVPLEVVRAGQVAEIVSSVDAYDLVHTHDPFMSQVFRNRFPNAKIVQTVHGTNYEHVREHMCSAPLGRRIAREFTLYNPILRHAVWKHENAGMSAADHLLAVDSNQARLACSRIKDPGRVSVIYNAVDVAKLLEQARQEPRNASHGAYFLMARRLSPKNGAVFAVEGFLDWVGERNVQLLIAGEGSQRVTIERVLSRSAVGDKVTLLGNVLPSRIPSLMRDAIATVVPSVPVGGVIEATSLAALESLALGTPVIASDIGGLSEIDSGSNIIDLVPPGDSHAIANAFDRSFRKASGTASNEQGERMRRIKSVEARFGIEVWVKTIKSVYEKTISDQSRCLTPSVAS